jgi:hypothetical protein
MDVCTCTRQQSDAHFMYTVTNGPLSGEKNGRLLALSRSCVLYAQAISETSLLSFFGMKKATLYSKVIPTSWYKGLQA